MLCFTEPGYPPSLPSPCLATGEVVLETAAVENLNGNQEETSLNHSVPSTLNQLNSALSLASAVGRVRRESQNCSQSGQGSRPGLVSVLSRHQSQVLDDNLN